MDITDYDVSPRDALLYIIGSLADRNDARIALNGMRYALYAFAPLEPATASFVDTIGEVLEVIDVVDVSNHHALFPYDDDDDDDDDDADPATSENRYAQNGDAIVCVLRQCASTTDAENAVRGMCGSLIRHGSGAFATGELIMAAEDTMGESFAD